MAFDKRAAQNPSRPRLLRRLIVVEGIDGAGTTTQARLLSERLRSTGAPVFSTSEPTDNNTGRFLRRVLSGEVRLAPETVAYLFAADRWEHVFGSGGILEHHDAGDVVVCDRYSYSSLAYQGVECDEALVRELNSRFPDPGLLIFLDLEPDVGERRLARRAHREIYEQTEIQAQVRSNYHRLLRGTRGETSVVSLSGSDEEAEIHRKIWEAVQATSILNT